MRVDIDPLLKKSFEQAGFEALGISGGGFAYLMSVKDIKNKDDLKAAKVWVPQGDHIAEAGFKAGGVTPIPLPLADVYTSLQTGLIDTAANTPAGAIAFQWHTKIKHMVDLPLTYVVGILVVDKKVFDALSPTIRRRCAAKSMRRFSVWRRSIATTTRKRAMRCRSRASRSSSRMPMKRRLGKPSALLHASN